MDFVTFEIARKLKDKGFDLETSNVYERNTLACRYEDYPKPTISQVLKWLREEKKIYVGISYMPKIISDEGVMDDFYYPTFQKIDLFEPMFFIGGDDNYSTYEEAVLAGIEYVLDNLIRKYNF